MRFSDVVHGEKDLITDVAGVRVGHHHRIDGDVIVGSDSSSGLGWATGCTVVRCPPGSVTAVDIRGGGPGTRETDLLDPVNSVQHANAIMLSGGSAFGLAAADGVMSYLEAAGDGLVMDMAGHVVPIVPAAVIFDLPVGGWDARPDAEFGRLATAAAGVEVDLGCVGAGAGARAGELKGGVGSASVVVNSADGDRIVVGAVVVVNAFGSIVDPSTGLPWHVNDDLMSYYGLSRPSEADRQCLADMAADHPILNTTIGVVATDAILTVAETKRIAMSAHDGLARAVRPAHTPVDGDTFFAVATGGVDAVGAPAPPGMNPRLGVIAVIGAAAALAVEYAIVRGVLAATPVGGIPTYARTLPTAMS